MSKSLEEYTKEELIQMVKSLKIRKKFGLVWEEKPEDVARNFEIEIPVLEEVTEREIKNGTNSPTHLIVEGDNYHSLAALNYTHAGCIDVIYADPPYNTGSNTWIYNNKIVDSNDMYRHSKWLSFMRKRLELALNLLKDSGIIVVTIDDYELFTLGLLMDEIFGEENKIGVIVVENNPRGRTSNKFYATSHEYYLIYAKNIVEADISAMPLTEDQASVFKFEDEISFYRLLPLRKSGAASRKADRPKQFYPIYVNPETLSGTLTKSEKFDEVWPIDESGTERVWKIGTVKCSEYLNDGTIVIKRDKAGKYSFSVKDRIKVGRKPKTVWVDPAYDASSHGATLLLKMFGQKVFDYPKSLWAVRDFLYTVVAKNSEAIVLDFFAGSGTTGHAVLELNKQDNGTRQFILCTNNENNIAENVTHQRIEKVVQGYSGVKGIPANVRYFRTKFVRREKTADQTRFELAKQCSNLIRIKDCVFENLKESELFNIYRGDKCYSAIIFDSSQIARCIAEIENFDTQLPVNLYIFSYSAYAFDNDIPQTVLNYEVFALPEGLLETYERTLRLELNR